MPVTYTNRKGVTYTLYRVLTTAGETRYVVARRSKGEPVDALPSGFRFNESPNGIVSLVRDRPALILPEETAAVEHVVGQSPRARYFRVMTKHNRIEIYAKTEPFLLDDYQRRLALGLALPDQEESWRELDELWAHFTPVLRFVLVDPARRWFRADELVRSWDDSAWIPVGVEGDVEALARAMMPSLDPDTFDDSFTPLASITAANEDSQDRGLRLVRTAARRALPPSATVHRLKVTLRGSRPPIWRRVVVPSNASLGELHDIVQLVMGWNDSHLHLFQIGDTVYGNLRQLEELGDHEERMTRLGQIAPRVKQRFRYQYDFGDSWEHDIVVEAVTPPEPETLYPVCTGGKRRCPPEDCGGIWGYHDFLEAIADPTHPSHAVVRDWWNGPFDAEAFDLDEVNRWLTEPDHY
jgi:hypothetical protein